jgi:hypothetical protein
MANKIQLAATVSVEGLENIDRVADERRWKRSQAVTISMEEFDPETIPLLQWIVSAGKEKKIPAKELLDMTAKRAGEILKRIKKT